MTETVIALSAAGVALAEKIAAVRGTQAISGEAIESLRHAFRLRQSIIAVGAAGIIIRALSPLIGAKGSKFTEPPVLCVSPDKAVIVLLGGHHGGNALAQEVAENIGGQAIISTASPLGEYLENPPMGWRASGDAKPLMAKSLRGDKIKLYDPYGISFLPPQFATLSDKESADVIISDKQSDIEDAPFVLHPPLLVLGIGCERNAPSEPMIKQIKKSLQELDLSAFSVSAIASIDIKCDEACLHALAQDLAVPLRFFSAAELSHYDELVPNPSDVVLAEVGCRSVAEAAVLASLSGMQGNPQDNSEKIICQKQKHGSFTLAIGRASQALPDLSDLPGSSIGKLDIIGIGPGDSLQRTESAVRALQAADSVVGYRLYLDLCEDTIRGKRLDYELGEERARCLKALQMAAAGDNVALVCSGDAGIYALASVVYDVLAEEASRSLNAVTIRIHPGISAFQLLAAKSGAPFGDDFCLISLSDLWVDESLVKRRIHAATEGDFAMGFYNPQSRKRRALLPYALQHIAERRGGEVPLIIGKNLGRAGESVKIMALQDFNAEEVDMLTLIMIGNSKTRLLHVKGEVKAYSPRILARKGAA